MKLLEMLEEYIVLRYPDDPDVPVNCDIELGEWQLARYRVCDCEIIFLSTGESLYIDRKLLKMCSGFYKSSNNQIMKAEDLKNSALWELIKICTRIVNNYSIDPERLKNIDEFRTWLKDKFNIDINPILYISRTKTLKL